MKCRSFYYSKLNWSPNNSKSNSFISIIPQNCLHLLFFLVSRQCWKLCLTTPETSKKHCALRTRPPWITVHNAKAYFLIQPHLITYHDMDSIPHIYKQTVYTHLTWNINQCGLFTWHIEPYHCYCFSGFNLWFISWLLILVLSTSVCLLIAWRLRVIMFMSLLLRYGFVCQF